jgi:hypothetical protein
MTITVVHDMKIYDLKISSRDMLEQYDQFSNSLSMDDYLSSWWEAVSESKADQITSCSLLLEGTQVVLQCLLKPMEDIELLLGKLSIPLNQSNATGNQFLQDIIHSFHIKEQVEKQLLQEIETLEKSRNELLSRYETYVQQREMSDSEIFQKFVNVLNSQKQ